MQVQKIQNNRYNQSFRGDVNTPYLKKTILHAVTYIGDEPEFTKKGIQFFNTIKLMKNDKTNKKLIMETDPAMHIQENCLKRCLDNDLISVSYGDLKHVFEDREHCNNYGLDAIVEIGKKLYGEKALNKLSKKMKKVLRLNKKTNNLYKIAEKSQCKTNKEINNLFRTLSDEPMPSFKDIMC